MSKKHTVRVNLYRLVHEAVDSGVADGLNRQYKHVETHTRGSVSADAVADAVMDALCEVIEFDDPIHLDPKQ